MKSVDQSVEYVDHMGTDLSVVNAARVSFHKVSELEEIQTLLEEDGVTFAMYHLGVGERDRKLINYLAKHRHWTPFGHTSLSLRIKCPIFVARQLGKHQVGLVWNEVSRRYVDDSPEFYVPKTLRFRAETAKQGSSLQETDDIWKIGAVQLIVQNATVVYEELLKEGICPEQARMVLPQNMMTEFIWTGSLAAFSRVCKLRLDPHTQKETQDVAKMIAGICAQYFPISFTALMEN